MGKYVTVQFDANEEYVHLRYHQVALKTEADVAEWKAEVERELRFLDGKRVDFIVDLAEMDVKPSVVAAYDEARLDLAAKTARRAYRYSGTRLLRTKILTSSTIHRAQPNVHATFEEALAAMRAERAKSR